MDLEGLSTICAGLGIIEEDDDGNRIGYTKAEFCLDNLKDLQRFLRRDDPQTRDVFRQVCKWNIVSKDLVPIIEHCQDDTNLVISAVKVMVFLTMPIEPGTNNIPDQVEYLWGLKAAISRNDTVAVIVSLLETPLENLEREAFTEDDWKLVQLVLTLFRNILAVQDITLQQKASGSATQYLSLRDRFIEILFHENVTDLILVLTQHVGGSSGYLRQDNLLLLEIFHCIFMGQEPALIAKASNKGSEVREDVETSLNSLRSIMEEEKDKKRRTRLGNLDRHTQFSGTFTRIGMDGSKTLCKGNPGTASRDSLVKSHKVQRGPVKRIACDSGKLSSSKENILELLRDFINQFLSAGYNVLMQSIREDIEKEHHAIQKNDVVVFFQVAQFVTAFQHHTFLISKPKTKIDASESVTDKFSDSTLFQGDICGPIAATLNEAMFSLVIYKWRNAFEGLKETNDYKFLSVAGSLMKNMIRMLDLVLKLFPEDSKETQTARILLYKIFYDQTDQGMTQFLVSLIKSFNSHKQPKSDLADLIEMIHVVVRLMENLQARGTLRVSKKSRRGKKKKLQEEKKAPIDERLGGDQVNLEGDVGISTCKPSEDSNERLEEPLANQSSDGNSTSKPTVDSNERLEEPLVPSSDGNSTSKPTVDSNERLEEPLVPSSDGNSTSKPTVDSNGQLEPLANPSSDGNSTPKPSIDSNELLEEPLANPSSDGKEKSTLIPDQVEDLEEPLMGTGNTVEDSALKENKEFGHSPDDLECEMGDSSEDDPAAATDEVDFNVSSLVSTFGNNTIIQNLCWLLRFYKSNSNTTNHYIISMLRRICDDLELSPMLYQLSLLTTFYDILDEQKSSTQKEYANIVSFLTNLVRKMLRKMKSQPLLFVEVLFWKTRKECHYITSESLVNELGSWRKESRKLGAGSSGNEGEDGLSQGQGVKGRRSIADALGDDEFDVVISQEGSYQKDRFHELNRSMTSGSNSEIDGVENDKLDKAHNEGHSVDKSLKVPNRKKRFVFDQEMETKIKNLYDKYKDERYCTRLIAEALDPDGKVSQVQVANKLKQLGLKVASKKRILRVDDSFPKEDDGQIRASENDSALHSLGNLEESSLLKRSSRSRKRIRAFSKEQEMMVKDLYEQFKNHKKCSHMIATALDADNTFTAAQISRKIKQLGLIKEKIPSAAKMHLRDEDAVDMIVDDGAEESDEETLLALKRRSKKNEKSMTPGEETATDFAKQDIEMIAPEDDSDDEILSSILERTGRKLPSKARGEKSTTSTIDQTMDESPEELERNEDDHTNASGFSPKDLEHDLSGVGGKGVADHSGNQAGELLDNVDDNVSHQLMNDQLEDSEDDMAPVALENVGTRRKLKMVIDMDDE